MRFILHSVFAAALIAAPACLKAAPRSINECEKIQAADAYNQCLALFGPVARGHGVARDSGDTTGSQDEGAVDGPDSKVVAAAADEELDHGHGRHHANRHGWGRHRWASHGRAHHGGASHSWAKHGHWHHTTTTAHQHGKRTTLAFNTVSGRAHLR